MRKYFLLLVLMLVQTYAFGQETTEEPDYIGEALLVSPDGSKTPLDKEYASLKSGVSLARNSWNVLKLRVEGGRASSRAAAGNISLVVRANDNNSDPMSVITIYKLKAKKSERTVELSSDHTGNPFASSRTYTKNMMRFQAKKYGTSSYLINIKLEAGEYGIIVHNPNTRDERTTIVSCLGVD